MSIRFHKTVSKQRLDNKTKQIVQTVEKPHGEHFERELAKAAEFLRSRNITKARGLYGAPI